MAGSDRFSQYAQGGQAVDPLEQAQRAKSQYTSDQPTTTLGDYSWQAPGKRPPAQARPAHFFLSGSGVAPSAGESVSTAPQRPLRLKLDRAIEWPGEDEGGYQEGQAPPAPPSGGAPQGGAPLPSPSTPSAPTPGWGRAIPGVDPRMDGGSKWPRRAASRVLHMTLDAADAALG
jgi:hypothetical protein